MRVAAIEDALVVLAPGDPAELDLLQGLGVVLATLHIPELDHLPNSTPISTLLVHLAVHLPVRAGGTEAVSHHKTVMAPGTPSTLISTPISTSFSTQLLPAEANCAVLSQGVWVKKDPGLGLKTVLDIDHGLILETRVA